MKKVELSKFRYSSIWLLAPPVAILFLALLFRGPSNFYATAMATVLIVFGLQIVATTLLAVYVSYLFASHEAGEADTIRLYFRHVVQLFLSRYLFLPYVVGAFGVGYAFTPNDTFHSNAQYGVAAAILFAILSAIIFLGYIVGRLKRRGADLRPD
jgi:hypothetical protein